MQLEADKHVLYRGPFGPPSIPGTYKSTLYKFFRKGNEWGGASIMGISGRSTGTARISFTSLANITIASCGSTGEYPTIAGNSVVFPEGSFWDLYLSDGTYIPDVTTGYNVADNGSNGTPSGFTVDLTNQGTSYFLNNGYNRTSVMIPARQSNTSIDILGNAILYTGVFNRHNMATGIIDYTLTQSFMFNKNAYVGNTYSLPEVWLSDSWTYKSDNPYHWLPTERTMSYIIGRLAAAYKNTIMIKENINSGTFVGISREEIFSPAISDIDFDTLNYIYNGIAI